MNSVKVDKQPAVNVVFTAVCMVSAAFLGGGFYYGMTSRKKALETEEKNTNKPLSQRKMVQTVKVIPFERKGAVSKPLAPSTAAWKALLSVTLVSVMGCGVLVCGAARAFGVTNMTDFQQRLRPTSMKDETMLLDFQKVDGVEGIKSNATIDQGKQEASKDLRADTADIYPLK